MAFSDNFNRANEDLESSVDWTRVDGVAGALKVVSNTVDATNATDTAYQCPDQGSADHKGSITRNAATYSDSGFPLSIRTTDSNNWIALRVTGTLQLYKRDTGSFTLLDSDTHTHVASDVWELEGDGNNITGRVNAVDRVTSIEAFNNTETRQGIVCRDAAVTNYLDDYTADTLVAAPLISVSPATVVDGQASFTIATTGMAPLTSLQMRSKLNTSHKFELAFTGASTPYTVTAPNVKVNTDPNGINGCPFTTAYAGDNIEFFADDGTLSTTIDVTFNPAANHSQVKTSDTPDVTSVLSIYTNFTGFYEAITAVSITGSPTTLTVVGQSFTNLQDVTISGLATTPDDANGEHIFTSLTDSGTILVNVTAFTDDQGFIFTGKAFEHGQGMWETLLASVLEADGKYGTSKTTDHFVHYFSYVSGKWKAVPITYGINCVIISVGTKPSQVVIASSGYPDAVLDTQSPSPNENITALLIIPPVYNLIESISPAPQESLVVDFTGDQFVAAIETIASAPIEVLKLDTGPPLTEADFGLISGKGVDFSWDMGSLTYLYLDRSNLISKTLFNSVGGVISLAGNLVVITRIVAICQMGSTSILIDSLSNPEAFDWLTSSSDSTVRLHFNDLTDFDNYTNKLFDVTLVVFDYGNPNGLRYRPFTMKIIKELI